MVSSDSSVPAQAHGALLAALITAAGSSLGDHLQLLLAVPLTTAGFVIAWVAAGRAGSRARPYRSIELALSAAVGVAIVVGPPSHTAGWFQACYWAYYAAGLAAVAAVAIGDAPLRHRVLWTMVGCAAALHLAVPIASERPTIDVWTWTDACVRALLHGAHPYTAQAADPTRGAFNYGYVTTVYPYMPLVLIAQAPATALAGDYRFGLALCLPIAILLLHSAGRRLRADDRVLDTAMLALLMHPRSVYMVSLGWTEPLMVLALALYVRLSVDGRRPFAEAFAFLLLPFLKQYVVAPVALYLAEPRRWRSIAIAAVVLAAATILPFAATNWRATVDGILFPLRKQAFRPDSDSLAAFAHHFTGFVPPRWLAPAVQLGVGAAAFARLRQQGLGGLLLASALALFASFLVGLQSFVNYYYFVGALLVCAAVAMSPPEAAA